MPRFYHLIDLAQTVEHGKFFDVALMIDACPKFHELALTGNGYVSDGEFILKYQSGDWYMSAYISNGEAYLVHHEVQQIPLQILKDNRITIAYRSLPMNIPAQEKGCFSTYFWANYWRRCYPSEM